MAAMEPRAVGDADRQIRQPRSAHKFGQRDKAGPEAGLWLEISSALTRFDKKRMNAIAEPCRASRSLRQCDRWIATCCIFYFDVDEAALRKPAGLFHCVRIRSERDAGHIHSPIPQLSLPR